MTSRGGVEGECRDDGGEEVERGSHILRVIVRRVSPSVGNGEEARLYGVSVCARCVWSSNLFGGVESLANLSARV